MAPSDVSMARHPVFSANCRLKFLKPSNNFWACIALRVIILLTVVVDFFCDCSILNLVDEFLKID